VNEDPTLPSGGAGPLADFIVELRNVTKRFGEYTALAGCSLEVRRGEFLTLLGPSGSGKTTILRLIAGFESPQAGEILLEGRNAVSFPPYRRNVNTVFQHYALFPHLDVFRNVAFGLEQRKLPPHVIRRRVLAALELVDLPGREVWQPYQLSGGEKQRVALARALVLEPAVLLLDEPLGALDEKLRKQMQIEFKRLHRRLGITFIFVTHDQEEALVMSDRVAVLSRGCIEQIGESREIYERPATRFVADFMGVENFLEVVCDGFDEGSWRFRTPSGNQLSASGCANLAAGACGALAVRPENLNLTAAIPQPRPPNLLGGVLIEAIYEGGTRRCTVELGNGQRLVARETSGAGLIGQRIPGAAVYVYWDAAKSLFYPEPPPARPS
jgi:ABC-type Fe3+/spermidine/putrescine transport system ATPase subunit